MRKLAIANQKGGAAKSTLTAHLAWASAAAGLRTLVVDFDAQGSASKIFEVDGGSEPSLHTRDLFHPQPKFAEPQRISESNLWIIRADTALAEMDEPQAAIVRNPARNLARYEDHFDVCLMDTPPSLGVCLRAALTAADYVVIPVKTSFLDLAGVSDLLNTIHFIKTQGFNPRLQHLGILPNKINPRDSEHRHSLTYLREEYGDLITPMTLHERASVDQSISRRMPVWHATRGEGQMKAAAEWKAACEYILGRMGQ